LGLAKRSTQPAKPACDTTAQDARGRAAFPSNALHHREFAWRNKPCMPFAYQFRNAELNSAVLTKR